MIKNKMIRNSEGLYQCTDCNYSTKYSNTCRNHIESKHLSTSGFRCKFCSAFCPTRHALTTHIGRKHK